MTLLFVWQKWDSITQHFFPADISGPSVDTTVVMYGTEWCGYCTKARSLMKENGIEYYEYDIDKSAEGRNQHKLLGARGVPVFVVNGEVIKGYDPDRLLAIAGNQAKFEDAP